MKTNSVNWFEIFAGDYQRAVTFYESILGTQLEDVSNDSGQMAMFPYDEKNNGITGAVSKMEGGKPGTGGTLVYLNVEGELDGVISRIPGSGGKMVKERTAIPPHGSIALFEDSEGNLVGLHSMS